MRIVHYYPRALVGDGGPTVAMWGWARAVLDSGVPVRVLCDAGLQGKSALRDPRIEVDKVPHRGSGRLRRPVAIRDFLETDDVLVLHSGYVAHNVLAARDARRVGVSYVVVPHGAYSARSRARRRRAKALWHRVEAPYLDRALGVHVFFESEVDDVVRLAPHAQCFAAPTGIDIPEQRWDGGSGQYVSWLGRFDMEHKGLDILLEAMTLIPTERRPQLHLFGRDSRDTRHDVEELARSLGVGSCVRVHGPVSGTTKTDALCRAVGYVHPSRWEAIGIALLENLALGVPCLVSDAMDIATVLRDRQAALVVPPDPASIAAGLMQLPAEGSKLGDAGRRLVRERFSWTRVATEFIEGVIRLSGR